MRTFRLAPFSPIAVNNVFNRFNLASSRFEVVGVEGFLTCGVVGVVWLYGSCSGKRPFGPSGMVFLLNVTHTKDAFWLYSDSYNLTTWTVWYINVFYWQVYQWFQFSNLTSNLLSCIVGHFLTKNLQGCWCNAEEQPTACRIEESTNRTYSILQLARCFL